MNTADREIKPACERSFRGKLESSINQCGWWWFFSERPWLFTQDTAATLVDTRERSASTSMDPPKKTWSSLAWCWQQLAVAPIAIQTQQTDMKPIEFFTYLHTQTDHRRRPLKRREGWSRIDLRQREEWGRKHRESTETLSLSLSGSCRLLRVFLIYKTHLLADIWQGMNFFLFLFFF